MSVAGTSEPPQLLYGLTVAADFPLHQDRPAPAGTPVDLTVVDGPPVPATGETPSGEVVLDFGEHPDRWYTAVRRPDGSVLLRVYSVCDIVLSPDLADVTVHLAEGADPGMRAIMTTGTLLALQLYLRGNAVLHASAVEQDGRAIAFVGHSGMGKSTLAALMCSSGARVVSDDVVPVAPADGEPPLVPLGATELRLRPGAEVLAAGFAPGSFRRRVSADQRVVVGLEPPPVPAVPLAAVVLPRPNREDHLGMELLDPKAAVFALMSFPRLMGWRDPAVLGQVLAHTSSLARTVPVLVAHVPWGPPFRDDVAETVWAAVDRYSSRV
ncbi:Hpr(Ser) kinase/phosphatase [Georgenia satyanarayanai]|uniref:Hpr(Ser) kinase/phosphatase n=1 Tax=Georgenia satyanarayanai TaxID=860221 RepID=A0A2Y9ACQ8_9MICO|nr:hypothetical protein [Georgenia satyanarayanai]PYG00688.1 Hpr(Ser) kinase/phosphatase [Georgenia satyanarayanai]SSA40077.1 Hpr(Ser) kinase/phosphatase [Georgenia satyanarayanai]